MTEMAVPLRDLTYKPEQIIEDASIVGFYPFDKMSLLAQEHIDQMATEAATLFVETMKVLQYFSDPHMIHALGSASIHNYVDLEHETSFTITDTDTKESLTMLYYKESNELGQRFHIDEVHPKPYRPNFTVKMSEIISHGRVQGMRSAT